MNESLDFESLLSRQRIVAVHPMNTEEFLDRLATTVFSISWPPHRVHKFARLAVDCRRLGASEDSLHNNLSTLIGLHWQLQFRRWETQKPMSSLDRHCLLMASKKLERQWRKSEDLGDPRLKFVISSLSGKNVMQQRSKARGILSLIRNRAGGVVFRLRLYGFAIELKRTSRYGMAEENLSEHIRKFFFSKVREPEPLLLQMMLGVASQRRAAARILSERFLEQSSGLLMREPNGHGRRRIYTRPLLFLALVCYAEKEVVACQSGSGCATEELPLPSLFGAHNRDAFAFLCAWDEAIKRPPELPASWGPGPSSLQATYADRIVRNVLLSSSSSLRVVDPLPEDAPFVFSIRHDVDRTLRPAEIEEIERFETKLGLKSTWFFKPETYDMRVANELLARGCEIGWHCSDAGSGDAGFAQRILDDLGGRVAGVSFHGGFGSFYWKGRSTLQDIAQLGFTYAEWPSDVFTHPRPWPWLPSGLYLTSTSLKIQSRPEFFCQHRNLLIQNRGHLIIENHPDLFDEKISECLEDLVDKGGLNRTIAQHVEACRDTDALVRSANARQLSC